MLGPQHLVEQFGVVADHGVGRLQDAAGRAIVLLQLHHLERRVIHRQFLQIFDICAAPAVDRLIVIAHRRKLRARTGEVTHQLVLHAVGVLIFIDQQIPHAVLPFIAASGVRLKNLQGQFDQIVEIDRLIGLHRRRVVPIDTGGQRFGRIAGHGSGLIFRHPGVLPAGNGPLQLANRFLVHALREFGHHRIAVVTVKDREAGLVAEQLGLFTQDTHAQRVEGRYRDAFGIGLAVLKQLGHPLLHLLGRLVGEGDGKDAVGRDTALFNQIGNFLRDDARLPRTGTGQHEQRTIEIADGLALSGVELGGHGKKQTKKGGESRLRILLDRAGRTDPKTLPCGSFNKRNHGAY